MVPNVATAAPYSGVMNVAADLYDGTCQLTRHEDPVLGRFVTVDHADPRIRINDEVMPELKRDGDFIRIEASNRTVIYRLVGYDFERKQHLAVWPD